MNSRSWRILAAVMALMVLTAGALLRLRAGQKLGNPGLKLAAQPLFDPNGRLVATNSVHLPEVVLDYTSQLQPVTSQELNWLPRDTTYGRRRYVAPDQFWLDMSVVLMGSDRTSIHKPQYCLEGQGFAIDDAEPIQVPVVGSAPYEIPVMKLTTSRQVTINGQQVEVRGLFLYWFVAEHQLTASHGERMWWMARDLIRRRTLERWAYVTCFAICLPGQETATLERMKRFVTAAVPEFQETGAGAEGALAAGVPKGGP